MNDGPAPSLTLRGVSKSFGAQRALNSVSKEFGAGSITALLGHNGSGKSTLVKILAGFYAPDADESQVAVHGVTLEPMRPRESHRLGLRFVHQDLGLIDELSIADNFAFVDRYLTSSKLGLIRRSREHERAAQTLDELGISLDPGRLVGSLDQTTKTMVAIARAIQRPAGDRSDGPVGSVRARVLVLDEPTAALPIHEVVQVLDLVRRVAETGGTVVYVTHRIEEVLEVASDVLVLRDGAVVADRLVSGLDAETLATLIVGQASSDRAPSSHRLDESATGVLFSARGLTGERLSDVSFELRRGQILGVAGLVGCGRSELARLVAGVQRPLGGECELLGTNYRPRDPSSALARGVAYVPQDRKREALIASMAMYENLTLGTVREAAGRWWLNLRRERQVAQDVARRLGVRPDDPRRPLGNFSGGNQQKVVLGRAMQRRLNLLVLDEPMQGIDVGARREIAHLIRELADDGVGVLMGSTDSDDLIEVCDEIMVLDRGRLSVTVAAADATDHGIARAMGGGAHA
jgi:ribose transport system ATP-binding protein